MADDINNNEGMGEAGDAGMPGDLKRLLARAEQGEDGDPDAYNPDADDDEEEDDDGELEESFGEVDRGASAGEDINGGQLQISEFGREMKQSFIEYSMSVITARALPDVRDSARRARGLKAGTPPHPLRDERERHLPQPPAQEVGLDGRRSYR